MYKEIYCYRIEPAAEAAYDESGSPCEAYLNVTATYKRDRLTDEEYARRHEEMRSAVAKMLDTAVENVTPIGYGEYADNVEDEGDEE